MALVNQTIPGLYGGVSQQAAELRHDTQVAEMINCYPSIIGGTQKRPPTSLEYQAVDQVQDIIPSDSFIYTYDRGTGDEQYLIIIIDGKFRVFDLVLNVWANDWTTHSYLDSNSIAPLKTQYALSTVGDTTFVVNKYTDTAMDDTIDNNDDENWQDTFYYWVKRTYGDIDNTDSGMPYTYYLRSNDPSFKFTSVNTATSTQYITTPVAYPAGIVGYYVNNLTKGWSEEIIAVSGTTVTVAANQNISVGDSIEVVLQYTHSDSNSIVSHFAGKINGLGSSDYSAEASGSVLKVSINGDYKLTGSDSWGNQASEGWQGSIKKLADLPNDLGFENAVIEITGDENTSFDNYYVKYDGNVYKETFKPGLYNELDTSTMPHKLEIRRNLNNTYTINFAVIEYESREVGDDNSASEPSFIGQPIQDVFFYRNRLGFLAGDNVILSESGEYYNFWPTTVTDVIDSDVIDVAVDSNQAINLNYALPFNKELLLFADKAQFVMSASDTLTPKDVSVQQSTAFNSARVEPIGLGPNVYFAIIKDNATQVREYYVQPDSLSNDAADITAHCPTYIPTGVTKLVGSNKNDMLFALSPETPNTIYVYNFYWQGEEKAQSAWHKWIFTGVDNIYDIQIVDGNLYLFTERSNNTIIEKINLQPITDISDIRYEDAPIGDEGSGVTIQSQIILTTPGFATSQKKVDDLRNKFHLKNIQLNVDYGSFYNLEITKYTTPRTYGYSTENGIFPSLDLLPSRTLLPQAVSYNMKSDHKYPISGKAAEEMSIKINNEILVGFKINSIDFFGNFVQKSRSV